MSDAWRGLQLAAKSTERPKSSPAITRAQQFLSEKKKRIERRRQSNEAILSPEQVTMEQAREIAMSQYERLKLSPEKNNNHNNNNSSQSPLEKQSSLIASLKQEVQIHCFI